MRKVIQKLKILDLRWKQVKNVYNDQPLGMTASGKIGGGYDSCFPWFLVRYPGVPVYLVGVPGYLSFSLVT